MGEYVASQTLKTMIKKSINTGGARVLILGLTFKENCSDLRNTRVVDIINELQEYECKVDVYDPWVNIVDAEEGYNISPLKFPQKNTYDAIIIAVSHDIFKKMGANKIHSFGKKIHVLYDLKYVLPADTVDLRL